MAGSWNHIVTDKGKFRGTQLIDNLGDAVEALEECYGMVWWMAEQLTLRPMPGWTREEWVERARQEYQRGIEGSPGYTRYAKQQMGVGGE